MFFETWEGRTLPDCELQNQEECNNYLRNDEDLFEGDIILQSSEKEVLRGLLKQKNISGGKLFEEPKILDEENKRKELFVRKAYLRYEWPNGKIPYQRLSGFPINEETLSTSIRDIESKTCIRFEEIPMGETIPKGKRYVKFMKDKVCASTVGSHEENYMKLTSSCKKITTVIHELMHVAGFWHEHSRPDRDLAISIIKEHIDPKKLYNFVKHDFNLANPLNVPYDIHSIMHYGPYAFQKKLDSREKLLTTLALNPLNAPNVGDRRYNLSFRDSKLANLMYECNKHCPNRQRGFCRNSGFVNQHCNCSCPPETIGSRCQTLRYDNKETTADQCKFYITENALYDEDRIVTSPNYPNYYDINTDCVWWFKGSIGKQVKITFLDFMIEPHEFCSYDNVRISLDGVGYAGKKYCGIQIKSGQVFTSTYNDLFLWLHSDRIYPYRGFKFVYEFVDVVGDIELRPTACHDVNIRIKDKNLVLSSANYPEKYVDNTRCFYKIKGATLSTGIQVILRDVQLDLDDDRPCSDFIQIIENDEIMMTYCASNTSFPSYKSKSNYLVIRFTSDDYGNKKGFQLLFRPFTLEKVPDCQKFYPPTYKGHENYAVGGQKCQSWTEQFPHPHRNADNLFERMNNESAEDASNFCRSLGHRNIWCYTTDPNVRWAKCKELDCNNEDMWSAGTENDYLPTAYGKDDSANVRRFRSKTPHKLVNRLDEDNRLTCQLLGNGKEYNGTRSWTKSGRPCQKWSSQKPWKHKWNKSQYFPNDENIDKAENYCRYFNAQVHTGGIWCIVDGKEKEWEDCSVPLCS
ncbi:hypothetical protein SNEBB_005151 [Seison nebaliae]|nr:hypothetical protein SNEBB_005151 [Seison nebaliae]